MGFCYLKHQEASLITLASMKPASKLELPEYLPHPILSHLSLSPPNLRLIENKDRMVVSIMGSSSARYKTWCRGYFIDVNGDGTISAVDYVNIKNYIMGNDSILR